MEQGSCETSETGKKSYQSSEVGRQRSEDRRQKIKLNDLNEFAKGER